MDGLSPLHLDHERARDVIEAALLQNLDLTDEFVVHSLQFLRFARNGGTDAVIDFVLDPVEDKVAMNQKNVGVSGLLVGFDELVTVRDEDA